MAGTLAAPCAARGQDTPDELQRDADETLQRAERALDAGNSSDAADWFAEASQLYQTLAESQPDWKPSLIASRQDYVANQLKALQQGGPAAATAARPAPAAPSAAADARTLNLRLQKIELEKKDLNQKLAEAQKKLEVLAADRTRLLQERTDLTRQWQAQLDSEKKRTLTAQGRADTAVASLEQFRDTADSKTSARVAARDSELAAELERLQEENRRLVEEVEDLRYAADLDLNAPVPMRAGAPAADSRQLKQLQEQLAQLQRARTDLQQRYNQDTARLQADLDKLRQAPRAAGQDPGTAAALAAAEARIRELESAARPAASSDDWAAEKARLEQELEASAAEQRREMSQTMQETVRFKRELIEAQDALAAAQRQAQSLARDKAALEQQAKTLAAQARAAGAATADRQADQAEIARLREETTALEARATAAVAAREELRLRLAEIEKTRGVGAGDLEKARSETTRLGRQVADLQELVATLRQQNDAWEAQNKALVAAKQKLADEFDQAAADHQKALEAAQQAGAADGAKLAETQRAADELRRKLADAIEKGQQAAARDEEAAGQVRALERDRETLAAQVARLEKQIQEKPEPEAPSAEVAAEAERQRQELQEAREAVKTLEKDLRASERKVARLEQQGQRQETPAAPDATEELQRQLEYTRAQYAKADERAERLDSEKSDLQARLDKVNTEYLQMAESSAARAAEMAALAESNQKLAAAGQQGKPSAGDEVAAPTPAPTPELAPLPTTELPPEQKSNLEELIHELEREKDDLSRANHDLSAKVTELAAARDLMATEKEQLAREAQGLRQQIEKDAVRILALSDELIALKNKATAADKLAQGFAGQQTNWEKERKRLAQENEKLQKAAADSVARVAQLKEDYSALEDEMTLVKEQRSELSRFCDEFSQRIEGLLQEKNRLAAEVRDYQGKSAEQRAQIEKLGAELAQANTAAADAVKNAQRANSAQAETKTRALQNLLNDTQGELRNVMKERETLRAQVDQLQAELAETTRILSDLGKI